MYIPFHETTTAKIEHTSLLHKLLSSRTAVHVHKGDYPPVTEVVFLQPFTQTEAPPPTPRSEGVEADVATRLTAEQYQQLLHLQEQQQQLQAQLQQAAQAQAAAAPPQWSALHQKLSLSAEFQTHPSDQVQLEIQLHSPQITMHDCLRRHGIGIIWLYPQEMFVPRRSALERTIMTCMMLSCETMCALLCPGNFRIACV